MQTSDQSFDENQPPVDHSSETSNSADHIQETHSSSNDLPEQAISQTSATKAADKEAIRRGLIYPPPPSFYEEMPLPVAAPNELKPPTVPTHGVSMHADTVPGENWHPSSPQEPYSRAGYPSYPQGQNYAGTQPPPFVAGPPRAKKSRKWTMIVLAVLAGIMLVSCGLCAWVGIPFFGGVYHQAYNVEVNGLQVVNDYYADLQNKQYTQAYGEISAQGSLKNLSLAAFTAQAEKQDSLYGPVLRYTPGQPNLNNYDGGTLTTFPITVNVARNKHSYTAHLQLTEVNNQWKITSFDHL